VRAYYETTTGEEDMRVTRKSNATTTYVPVSERSLPEDEQFSVQIRRLDFIDRAKIRDKMVEFNDDGTVENIRMFSIGVEVAADVLDGWKNLYDDETGAEITYDRRNRNAMFDILPDEIQEELGQVFATGLRNKKAEQRLLDAYEEEQAEEAAAAEEEAKEDEVQDSETEAGSSE
jgi:hypothetical protein